MNGVVVVVGTIVVGAVVSVIGYFIGSALREIFWK